VYINKVFKTLDLGDKIQKYSKSSEKSCTFFPQTECAMETSLLLLLPFEFESMPPPPISRSTGATLVEN